jgi:glycosyltransferase involved in cell wall biosynthesis
MKPKLLCILHRSPPAHGAAKVGDFIGESQKLQEKYKCKFITIKSSDTIGDIGKVNFKKLYLVGELYVKILYSLMQFRPDKIYFTASVKGVAFYRDVLLSTLWKIYQKIKKVEVYYHYHTKGVYDFVSSSSLKLYLSKFFLKDVNLILLSPLLADDFDQVKTYKQILFLPNGVEDNFKEEEFENYVEHKNYKDINILYLSNMIKSKGYFEVLKLAQKVKNRNYHFHFAGGWQNDEDKENFFSYIKENSLENSVTFHGFVNGEQKKELFMKASLFILPTKYEAFPLSILEAFSYGLPVIVTDEGSIPFIVDNGSGVIVSDLNELDLALDEVLNNLVNKETSYYCRKRYLDNFSLEQFENNLVEIFQ